MRLGALFLAACVAAVAAEGPWSVQRLTSLDYPLLAQQARIQGEVKRACAVRADGQVDDCSAVSGHPLLQSAAIANAKRWLFRRTASDASGDEVQLRYVFLLQDKPVRHQPHVEFTFEYPTEIRISSETPCADHIPCTPEEWKQYRRNQHRANGRRSIP